MVFASFLYLFCFLPVATAGYFAARKFGMNWARAWLIVCSVLFYCAAGPRYLPVLAGSLLLNYTVSHAMRSAGSSRRLLLAGIAGNLAILCVFKYAQFIVTNVNAVFGLSLPTPPAVLPAGVSFFTIQQIMYLVDRAEGLAAHQNMLQHAVFVTFFPYVLIGPLTRAGQVLPQFEKPQAAFANADNICRGVVIILVGLFKKAVLAAAFARWANLGFDYGGQLAWADSWIAAASFAFQLYFDFSGYTDMALGSALLFNIELPQNFDAPFRARSIIEFWRRWHMTLTAFITSYLYTPIVRSFRKVTFGKAMLATLIAMTLAGLWHGAAWTYVLFGLAHGIALVINNWSRRRKWRIPDVPSRILTLGFLLFGFVLFRSADLSRAAGMLHSMIWPAKLIDLDPFRVMDNIEQTTSAAWMAFGAVIAFAGPTSAELLAGFRPRRRMLALAASAALCSLFYLNSLVSQGFVYRDF